VAVAARLLHIADADGAAVVQLGGWAAPAGISLVADRLSALLLVVSASVLLAVLLYAIGQGVADGRRSTLAVFHPCYLVLAAGISMAFLTGDLFNLFVAFEVMLVASYVLITLDGGKEQVRAGMTYVVVSLLASVLFVTVVGLGLRRHRHGEHGRRRGAPAGGTRTACGSALGLTDARRLRIKAALFPLFSWLPDSYPDRPVAGHGGVRRLLTRSGVYAVIRTQTLLFPGDEDHRAGAARVAALTMVGRHPRAIVQDDVKRVLSFTIVSHIGYMLLGLGLVLVAGLAGAFLYTVHHIVVQTDAVPRGRADGAA
jgi:multicomponent Na+:H+ antiporter subunit D